MSQWRKLTNKERSRTYHFFADNGDKVQVEVVGVKSLRVSPSGTHYIETETGKKLIIKNTWYTLEINADKWSF